MTRRRAINAHQAAIWVAVVSAVSALGIAIVKRGGDDPKEVTAPSGFSVTVSPQISPTFNNSPQTPPAPSPALTRSTPEPKIATPAAPRLRRIVVDATSTWPKSTSGTVSFTLYNGAEAVASKNLSPEEKPWSKPQKIAFDLKTSILVADIQNLYLEIEKKPRTLFDDLGITVVITGFTSDSRSILLAPKQDFTLGTGSKISGAHPSQFRIALRIP